jgi:hypothetical protein
MAFNYLIMESNNDSMCTMISEPGFIYHIHLSNFSV